jgi:hypothetical protein
MSKPDFPALLAPGCHQLTIDALEGLAVTPFPGDPRRPGLIAKLRAWVAAIRAYHVTGTLWIDGSFLTQKPSPGDIDLVFRRPGWSGPAPAAGSPQEAALTALFDRRYARAQYELDLYVIQPRFDAHAQDAYWQALLGTCHDGVTAKGFVEVTV